MNKAVFYTHVREAFGPLNQSQVEGFEVIIEAWDKVGDGNIRHFAYVLSTAWHETARTMQPVRETRAKTDAKAKEILTKAWRAGKLPWVKSDYWSSGWFGRGFVQLTHRDNYVKAGGKLGIDLVSDPSKAMIPEVSALILVRGMQEGWFTGRKLSDAGDFLEARRIVNGTDKAGQIATYANSFLSALEAAKAASASPKPVTPPAPEKPASGRPKPKGDALGWVAGIAVFLGLLWTFAGEQLAALWGCLGSLFT